MLRRLIYLLAFVLAGMLLLIAVVEPEVRIGFAFLAGSILSGSWWLARRLPARPVPTRELHVTAAIALILGVAFAVLVPSTRAFCDCPIPLGAPAGSSCNCAIDHHMVMRVSAALAGAGLATALSGSRGIEGTVSPGARAAST